MDKPETKEAKARLSREFHRQVSQAILDRDSSMQDAIEEGLRLWLARGGAAGEISHPADTVKANPSSGDIAAGSEPAYNQDKTTDWHRLLTRVLDSGHAVAIDALTRNLFAFDLLVSATEESREDYPLPTVEQIRSTLSPDTARAYEEYLRATGRVVGGSATGPAGDRRGRKDRAG